MNNIPTWEEMKMSDKYDDYIVNKDSILNAYSINNII